MPVIEGILVDLSEDVENVEDVVGSGAANTATASPASSAAPTPAPPAAPPKLLPSSSTSATPSPSPPPTQESRSAPSPDPVSSPSIEDPVDMERRHTGSHGNDENRRGPESSRKEHDASSRSHMRRLNRGDRQRPPRQFPHDLPPVNFSIPSRQALDNEKHAVRRIQKLRRKHTGEAESSDEAYSDITERFGKMRGKFTKRGHDQGSSRMVSTGMVPRNRLVAQFENETTKHFKEEWRRRPEIPSQKELLGDLVGLPCNNVDAPWDDVNEYLETHYELLREDCFAYLRDGITFMRDNPDSNDTKDVCLYENTRIVGLTWSNWGVAAKVCFSLNRAGKRVKWAHSKRLIPGSLVCLSDDEFVTIHLATVVARPLAPLEFNPPEVDLLFDEFQFDVTRNFMMLECRQGYFEFYRHNMRALQRMTKENFPLYENIVTMKPKNKPPQYVLDQPFYDISSVFVDERDSEKLEDINILTEFPTIDTVSTSMDQSQLSALHSMLTKKLAVVQGPPGTGKTFTSVQALRLMLSNMSDTEPPIVVCTHTNHALDQLLRHVVKFEPEIVRLGSRSTDKDEIKKRTMYELRRKNMVNVEGNSIGQAFRARKRLQEAMTELLKPFYTDLIPAATFFELGLISAEQHKSFDINKDWVGVNEDGRPDNTISIWLEDRLAPVIEPVELYTEYEEADIEYETLKEMEAEFKGNAEDDDPSDEIRGLYKSLKRNFAVEEPMGVPPEELEHALKCRNLWDLETHLRAAVYCYLEDKVFTKLGAKAKALSIEYAEACKKMKIARMEQDCSILQNAKLIGMTTTGLAKNRSLVAAIQPKVVMIEEAAESMEAPIAVCCLPSVQQMILVGDHKQLRPHTSVHELEGEPYNLNVSMFERLVMNDIPYTYLRTQRRMRPEFRQILSPFYGKEKLKDHETCKGREPIPGMGNTNLFWMCHSAQETTAGESLSKINTTEAYHVWKFCSYLVHSGTPPNDITVLTFYTGQRNIIQQHFRSDPNFGNKYMQVVTVDSYQGEENEIIILSLVRSNFETAIGFLSIPNRVCVALSRARRGFYIFGNGQMLSQSDRLWWDIVMDLNEPPVRIGFELPLTCSRHKTRTMVESMNDWDDITGGCRKPCNERLSCGHRCPLRCHAFSHADYNCAVPCRRPLKCGHRCVEKCALSCRCEKCGFQTAADSDKGANKESDNDSPGPRSSHDAIHRAQTRGVAWGKHKGRQQLVNSPGSPQPSKRSGGRKKVHSEFLDGPSDSPPPGKKWILVREDDFSPGSGW